MIRLRRSLRTAVVCVLAACSGRGDEDVVVAPAAEPAPAPFSGDFVVRRGATGDPGSPAARPATATRPRTSTPPSAPCGVQLEIELSTDVVAWGEPVPARLRVTNRTTAPIAFWDIAGDIARRMEMRYEHGGRALTATQGLPPSLTPWGTESTSVRPDESLTYDVDLLPWLRRTIGWAPGRIAFHMAWTGNAAAVPHAAAWNADPSRIARTPDLVLRVLPPKWLTRLGGDDRTVTEAEDALTRWNHESPGSDDLVLRTSAGGSAMLGSVVFVASNGALATAEAELRAGRAMRLLRRVGAPALPALRAAATPASTMVQAIVEEDRDPARDASEVEKTARRIGGGTDDAASLHVAVRGRGDDPPVSWTVDARANLVRILNHGEPTQQAVLRPLAADRLAEIKRAVLTGRPWTWQRQRPTLRLREGTVSFTLTHAGRTVWTLTLPGDEAFRGNPFAADVIAAFTRAAGDGTMQVASGKLEPGR